MCERGLGAAGKRDGQERGQRGTLSSQLAQHGALGLLSHRGGSAEGFSLLPSPAQGKAFQTLGKLLFTELN